MASDADPVARYEPVPDDRPIEAIIGNSLAKRALYVGPLVVLVFGLARGGSGAIAAALGVAVVVGNFILGGAILSSAARISLSLYHAAAFAGFFIRFGLITVSMLVVAWLFEVDRIAFGLAAVVTYLVLLLLEVLAMRSGAWRKLEWTD